MSDLPNIQDLSFENAYTELEAIINKMESGDVPLAESVTLYERGQALAVHCERLLENATLRVSQLNADDSLTDLD